MADGKTLSPEAMARVNEINDLIVADVVMKTQDGYSQNINLVNLTDRLLNTSDVEFTSDNFIDKLNGVGQKINDRVRIKGNIDAGTYAMYVAKNLVEKDMLKNNLEQAVKNPEFSKYFDDSFTVQDYLDYMDEKLSPGYEARNDVGKGKDLVSAITDYYNHCADKSAFIHNMANIYSLNYQAGVILDEKPNSDLADQFRNYSCVEKIPGITESDLGYCKEIFGAVSGMSEETYWTKVSNTKETIYEFANEEDIDKELTQYDAHFNVDIPYRENLRETLDEIVEAFDKHENAVEAYNSLSEQTREFATNTWNTFKNAYVDARDERYMKAGGYDDKEEMYEEEDDQLKYNHSFIFVKGKELNSDLNVKGLDAKEQTKLRSCKVLAALAKGESVYSCHKGNANGKKLIALQGNVVSKDAGNKEACDNINNGYFNHHTEEVADRTAKADFYKSYDAVSDFAEAFGGENYKQKIQEKRDAALAREVENIFNNALSNEMTLFESYSSVTHDDYYKGNASKEEKQARFEQQLKDSLLNNYKQARDLELKDVPGAKDVKSCLATNAFILNAGLTIEAKRQFIRNITSGINNSIKDGPLAKAGVTAEEGQRVIDSIKESVDKMFKIDAPTVEAKRLVEALENTPDFNSKQIVQFVVESNKDLSDRIENLKTQGSVQNIDEHVKKAIAGSQMYANIQTILTDNYKGVANSFNYLPEKDVQYGVKENLFNFGYSEVMRADQFAERFFSGKLSDQEILWARQSYDLMLEGCPNYTGYTSFWVNGKQIVTDKEIENLKDNLSTYMQDNFKGRIIATILSGEPVKIVSPDQKMETFIKPRVNEFEPPKGFFNAIKRFFQQIYYSVWGKTDVAAMNKTFDEKFRPGFGMVITQSIWIDNSIAKDKVTFDSLVNSVKTTQKAPTISDREIKQTVEKAVSAGKSKVSLSEIEAKEGKKTQINMPTPKEIKNPVLDRSVGKN